MREFTAEIRDTETDDLIEITIIWACDRQEAFNKADVEAHYQGGFAGAVKEAQA